MSPVGLQLAMPYLLDKRCLSSRPNGTRASESISEQKYMKVAALAGTMQIEHASTLCMFPLEMICQGQHTVEILAQNPNKDQPAATLNVTQDW